MAEDARFEDGAERPLRLRALDDEDLRVLSSLVQDAVFPLGEMTWDRGARRFALLINRFRWEELTERRAPERVQSVLAIEDVSSVRSQGLDRQDKEVVLSLLSIEWRAGDDGTGHVSLLLAGDGVIELAVEALELSLRDVTRPYVAPSGKRPDHPA
ncbi:MAG: DUF2948 family protein [Pseudomonadota bacterium]